MRQPFTISIRCVLLAAPVLCLMLVSNGCGTGYSEDFREEVSAADLEDVIEKTGLPLPSTATAEGIWITYKPSRTISLKLSMTSQEVDKLLKSGPIKAEDLMSPLDFEPEESEQLSFPPNRRWWNPGTQESLLVGTTTPPEGGIVCLGVLRGKGKRPTSIYVTWDPQVAPE